MTTPQLGNPNRVELTQLEFDRRLVLACRSTPETAISAIGLRRVLEASGIERVIEAIGMDKIVEYFVEKYGFDGFIALLLENHREQVREFFERSPAGVLPPPTPRAE